MHTPIHRLPKLGSLLGKRNLLCLLGLCLLATRGDLGSTATGDEPSDNKPPVARIEDFTLADHQGQEHRYSELAGDHVAVVVFLGTECPLVNLYTARLNRLHETYAAQGVVLIGVYSNRQDTAEEVADHVREHHLAFPVLMDPKHLVADLLRAKRTPEVFLLDQKRAVRYRGRIDDQYGVDYQRPRPTRNDLVQAMDQVLAGKPVSLARTETAGCFIGRRALPASGAEVTYYKDVAPILDTHCVGCHREGEIAPFSLTDYDEIVGWGETIREVIDQGRMPPWFASPDHGTFVNNPRMGEREKELINRWVADGCPEGDPADLPRKLAVADHTPEPFDAIYPMSDEPFNVPATGVVDYQYHAIDPGWTDDHWVRGIEALPGVRSVVHHILIFVERPGANYESIYPGELIGGYVPGLQRVEMAEGRGIRIPAGSKIIFQMHYTPNGTAQQDMSHVAFRFADPADIQYEVSTPRAINIMFQIPPGATDYPVVSTYTIRRDALLLKLIPHMHVRGKTFRYEAHYPDGQREILLDVPDWDFNWQLQYELAEPKPLPKGTRLVCTATYDNSDANRSNPDPTQWVTFGEQTWDEMMIGFFVIAEKRSAETSPSPLDTARSVRNLVEAFLPKQEGQGDLAQRASHVARNSLDLLYQAQQRGLLQGIPEMDEVEHVILGTIDEVDKQELLSGVESGKRPNPRRGLRFLLNTRNVVRAITSQGDMKTTRVKPVELPK
jgi:peroxiredoxin